MADTVYRRIYRREATAAQIDDSKHARQLFFDTDIGQLGYYRANGTTIQRFITADSDNIVSHVWNMGDDTKLYFGDDGDFSIRFDSNLIFTMEAGDFDFIFSGGAIGVGTLTPIGLAEFSSTSTHPFIAITGKHDSAYDPQIQFGTDATPTVKFALGVDAGNSDRFVITPTAAGVGDQTHFVMDTGGYISINVAPNTSNRFYLYEKTAANATGAHAFRCDFDHVVSVAGARNVSAFSFNCSTTYTANNTGNNTAIELNYNHNSAGVLTNLYGFNTWYGCGASSGGTTMSCGYFAHLRMQGGTQADTYDYYADAPTTGGTVTRQWVFYSAHDAPSRFIGNISIDASNVYLGFGTSATNTLAGDAGIRYDNSTSRWYFETRLAGAGNIYFVGGASTYFYEGSITDNQNKGAFHIAQQYDTDEAEGFVMMASWSNSTTNDVYIGGGWAAHNCVENLYFVTAANSTTRTGNYVMTINNLGQTIINGINDFLIDSNTYGLVLGDSQPVRISHDGTNTYFSNLIADGNFIFKTPINDATWGPIIRLYKNSTSPADDDLIGALLFSSNTDNGAGGVTSSDVGFGYIQCKAVNTGNADKEGSLHWYLRLANNYNEAMYLTGAGGLYVDADVGTGDDPVGLFDDYDDPKELQTIVQKGNVARGVELGIYNKKENGRYMYNVQKLNRLFAGGIYQLNEKINNLIDENLNLRNRLLAIEGKI